MFPEALPSTGCPPVLTSFHEVRKQRGRFKI